jgi:hypothetical protein
MRAANWGRTSAIKLLVRLGAALDARDNITG